MLEHLPSAGDFLTLYGPLGLGWIVAAVYFWRNINEEKQPSYKEIVDKYEKVLDAYHTVILENTRVTERLAMLIEARTRQNRNGQ